MKKMDRYQKFSYTTNGFNRDTVKGERPLQLYSDLSFDFEEFIKFEKRFSFPELVERLSEIFSTEFVDDLMLKYSEYKNNHI